MKPPGVAESPLREVRNDLSTRELKVRRVLVKHLLYDDRNPRTHSEAQIAAIAASISEFGWTNPILILPPHNLIIAGHARLLAARMLGLMEVPAIEIRGLSDAQIRALVIADNQLPLNAGWNEDRLRAELDALQTQVFDLDLIGFDEGELAELLADQDVNAADLDDPDEIPATPEDAVTARGDLWLLGDHRLLCGDASDKQAVSLALGGGQVEMVFTDPPDSVSDESGASRTRKNDCDSLYAEFDQSLRGACANLIAACVGGIYICTSPSGLHSLQDMFTEAGGHFSTLLIWTKHNFTSRCSDYKRQYEPILYGWRAGSYHHWGGGRNQGDVWSIPQPIAQREHSTIQPVELVERAIRNSSRKGGAILDPFAGSGTTLIACERQERRARLIEINPLYADVICQRWQQYTGSEAVLEGDGRAFDEIARERRKVRDEPRCGGAMDGQSARNTGVKL